MSGEKGGSALLTRTPIDALVSMLHHSGSRHPQLLQKRASRRESQDRKFEKLPETPGQVNAGADNEVHGYHGEYSRWSGQYRRQTSVLKGLSAAPSWEGKKKGSRTFVCNYCTYCTLPLITI